METQVDRDSHLSGTLNDAEFWQSIDWKAVEADVRRMRQRIYRAARENDLKRVCSLQRLMLRSRANTLISVKRVTQLSTGKKTAGIDGETALTPSARGRIARQMLDDSSIRERPVKRVYIPKANGKQRPLGIPVIRDRINQARAKNALEPEWEARFEARSYGFRPGRGTHDAIEAIFGFVRGRKTKRQWVLDADLKAAFDRISHERLMAQLSHFPGRNMIRGWLKAGVLEDGRFSSTEEGTPQGGVISPLLLNIALHGMGSENQCNTGEYRYDPALIRYADDFVVLCITEEEAWKMKARLADWLAPRGLTFNEDKTRVVHLDEGFDFLGFNVRKYNGKALVKPSEDAMKRARQRIRETVRGRLGGNAHAIVRDLNPYTRGWSTYYRHAISSAAFQELDAYTYTALRRWAVRSHPSKTGKWVAKRYWGQFHPARKDKWVFGSKDSYLQRFAWTKIQRHTMVKGDASPDDPELADYWRSRARKRMPTLESKRILGLAARQKGLCTRCGQDLVEGAGYDPDDVNDWAKWFTASLRGINVHHLTYRSKGGSDHLSNLEVIHTECHRQYHAGDTREGRRQLRQAKTRLSRVR